MGISHGVYGDRHAFEVYLKWPFGELQFWALPCLLHFSTPEVASFDVHNEGLVSGLCQMSQTHSPLTAGPDAMQCCDVGTGLKTLCGRLIIHTLTMPQRSVAISVKRNSLRRTIHSHMLLYISSKKHHGF